jgi:hypothetical protein
MNRASSEQAAASGAAHADSLHSWKGVTAARREVLALIASIERRALTLGKDTPDLELRVRKTPERCIVQAGRFALSVSWLQPQAHTAADSALLVIEWDGVVTLHGEPPLASRRATLFRERRLHLEAASGTAWLWRSDASPARAFTSDELAQWCVQLLGRRAGQDAPAAVRLGDGA